MEEQSGRGVFNQRREGRVDERGRDGLEDGRRGRDPLQMNTTVEWIGGGELDVEMTVA